MIYFQAELGVYLTGPPSQLQISFGFVASKQDREHGNVFSPPLSSPLARPWPHSMA